MHTEMGSNNIEYGFLKEIGLGSENIGGYINGKWKASGPVISTVNPSNNQVHLLRYYWIALSFSFYIIICFFTPRLISMDWWVSVIDNKV